MPIHITMNDTATRSAQYLLSRQQMPEQRRVELLKVTKVNLLIKTFNVSSLLLIAAAVSALVLAITTSSVFLAMGLFLRLTTERELEKYKAPWNNAAEQPQGVGHAIWRRLREAYDTALLRHATQQLTEEEKIRNIFLNIGLPVQADYVQDEVIFLDFAVWKNTIDIPEVVVQINPQQEIVR